MTNLDRTLQVSCDIANALTSQNLAPRIRSSPDWFQPQQCTADQD
ncbi:Uncharacterised protein [Vibrio cholerae]|nr:Uncharacterised protein [Vibrio cholerae]